MSATTMIVDLFRYNGRANGRVLRLCAGLTVEQLDHRLAADHRVIRRGLPASCDGPSPARRYPRLIRFNN